MENNDTFDTEGKGKNEGTKLLLPQNPRAPHNISKFSASGSFQRDDQIEQTAFHLSFTSSILLKTSPEAIEQEEIKKKKKKIYSPSDGSKSAGARNQFNFADRGSQTAKGAMKDKEVCTSPPARVNHVGSVTSWNIFDAYKAELQGTTEPKEEKPTTEVDFLYSDRMAWSVKLMERCANRNSDANLYAAFRSSEENGAEELFPLWNFHFQKTAAKHVTSLKFCPSHKDLFAVGYGSFDFLKDDGGAICCFSLRSTKYPEYIFFTESGVSCLAWHPNVPALLAVGLQDGNVRVYDATRRGPLYSSKEGKHACAVGDIVWGTHLDFTSTSSDARVVQWSVLTNKLQPQTITELKSDSVMEGGTCLAFSKINPTLFLVGTENGSIFECSKGYRGEYINTYTGHSLCVYGVEWSKFEEETFASCSADWKVMVWRRGINRPISVFDLAAPVIDLQFHPHISTSLSALSEDGKIHLFLFHKHTHKPFLTQQVVKNGKATKLEQNDRYPFILVGTDSGVVSSFKLPRSFHSNNNEGAEKEFEIQHERLTDILSVV